MYTDILYYVGITDINGFSLLMHCYWLHNVSVFHVYFKDMMNSCWWWIW